MHVPPLIDRQRGTLVALLTGLALTMALAAGLAALATRWLFNSMTLGHPLPPAALIMLAGAGLLTAAVRIAFRRYGERLGQSYIRQVRAVLFEHASLRPPADLARQRTGYVMLRFVGDLTALKDWPARGLVRLIEATVTLPLMIALLFWLDRDFGLIGLAVAGFALGGLVLMLRGLMAAHRELRRKRAQLAADMAERMPIAPQLALMGRRPHEARLLRMRAARLTRAALNRTTRAESLRSLPDAALGLAAAAVIWRGAAQGLDTGSIAAGLAVLGLLARPLRAMAGIPDRWSAWRAARAKLADALARPVRPDPGPRDIRLQPGPLELRLEGLSLPGHPPLSLMLAAGGRAELALPVAALADAITGLDPAGGTVRLNGQLPQHVTPGSLRRAVARIDTAPVALKGTIRRALTLAQLRRMEDAAILRELCREMGDGV